MQVVGAMTCTHVLQSVKVRKTITSCVDTSGTPHSFILGQGGSKTVYQWFSKSWVHFLEGLAALTPQFGPSCSFLLGNDIDVISRAHATCEAKRRSGR